MIKDLLSEHKYEFLIFIIILFSRLIVADFSDSFHSMDCVNYILAVEDYNIDAERPHLPGYIIYVAFFKFLDLFLTNGNIIFIVFQGIFQAISGILLFTILKSKISNKENLIYMLFIFSLPTIYFFGIVSEIYSIDLLIISIYLYLFHKNKIYYILPFIAFIAGIRQSSGGLLIPSALFLIYIEIKSNEVSFNKILLSAFISIAIILAWFIPLTQSMGGFENYFLALEKQKELLVSYKLTNNIISFLTYSFFYLIPISIIIISSKYRKIKLDKSNIFYLLIIIPQLILFIFYHYNKGYALLLIPALIIFLSRNFKIRNNLLVVISTVQLIFFYLYPGKIPSFNTQIIDNYRNISKYETWYERFNYWWLPTVNANQKTVELHNEFEKHSNKIDNILNGKKLIVDNSVIIRARNFAYIAPNIKICERTYYNKSSYEKYYKHINFSVENDLVKNFSDFYILVEKEYYDLYLKEFSNIMYETKFNYIISIDEINKFQYLNLNEEHFIGKTI